MNIETANRLYQYRKQMGISQEELASRIGVSRQAVSKWERAEASPDTDNLIELSKVYGVTLDEMLRGDHAEPEAAETEDSKKEEVKSEDSFDNESNSTDAQTGAGFNADENRVHIGFDGIHVNDKNGTKVDIDKNGVFVTENGGQKVYTDTEGVIHKSEDITAEEQERKNKSIWLRMPFPIVAVLAYVLFGTINIMGGWAWGWIVFLTIPLYYTLVEAVIKRRPVIFAYPVLAAMIYLILGASLNLWHPGWIVFLTIPIFYWIAKK